MRRILVLCLLAFLAVSLTASIASAHIAGPSWPEITSTAVHGR